MSLLTSTSLGEERMPTPRVVLSRLTALLCVLALFSTSVLAQAPAAQGTAAQPAQAEATVQPPSAAQPPPTAGAVFATTASRARRGRLSDRTRREPCLRRTSPTRREST